MLDLFRAIVPVYHQNSIEEIPGLSMLFFNDCMYISHHLLTLGFQYQSKLPAPLNKTATFVDLIPLFRQLGAKYYNLQMKKREQALLDFVKEAGGLGKTNDDERFSFVEKVIRKLILGLTQLSKAWKVRFFFHNLL
jgi:centromere/kinetochore protein ZW10